MNFYESQRQQGTIRFYGMATWECFRVTSDNPQFLSLNEVLDIAKKVGGEDHGFRFIQLPFNMYLDQAYMIKNQPVNGNTGTILDAAMATNIGVFTSVPLMQAKLLSPGVMPEFGDLQPSLRALQFTRSTPGILAPLVGQKTPEHVSENLKIMQVPSIPPEEFQTLVKNLVSK